MCVGKEGRWERGEGRGEREEEKWRGRIKRGEGVDFTVDQPHLIACSPYLLPPPPPFPSLSVKTYM